MKSKIAIITHTHKIGTQHCYLAVHNAFEKLFNVTWILVDYGWPSDVYGIPDYKEQRAIIWLVGFKHLRRKEPFDWGDYNGLRVMYDFDACQNYGCGIGNNPYKGEWPIVFRRQKFDLFICTGKETTLRLRQEGINTYWLPKAYEGERFYNKDNKRKKKAISYYGNMYSERWDMIEYLNEHGISTDRISCSYFLLNDFLNIYKACVVYNGIEPMIKQFEISASGCVPFCNDIPELSELGFEDGKTMVTYETFMELAEKLKYYYERPDKLYLIGDASAAMSKKNHTWIHRINTLKEELKL